MRFFTKITTSYDDLKTANFQISQLNEEQRTVLRLRIDILRRERKARRKAVCRYF